MGFHWPAAGNTTQCEYLCPGHHFKIRIKYISSLTHLETTSSTTVVATSICSTYPPTKKDLTITVSEPSKALQRVAIFFAGPAQIEAHKRLVHT